MPTNSYPLEPILLVDDEVQFLQSGSFSLRSSGITNIITCQESTEVMNLLDEHYPGVVVLDILMPHLTGKDLLPEIKRKFPHLPVIMLTAVNEVESVKHCIDLGAEDHLIKPFNAVLLKSRIAATLLAKEKGTGLDKS